jgi:hypothetical protein
VDRGGFDRKWRFHDEMQYPIRPDQKGEILIGVIIIGSGSGDLEDSLRVFEQSVHAQYLSAGAETFR